MKLLDIANENSYSIFLLGGKEGVSETAARNIKKDYPNIKIAGFLSNTRAMDIRCFSPPESFKPRLPTGLS